MTENSTNEVIKENAVWTEGGIVPGEQAVKCAARPPIRAMRLLLGCYTSTFVLVYCKLRLLARAAPTADSGPAG